MSRDILFDCEKARFSYRIGAVITDGDRVLLQCPPGTRDYAFPGGHVSFGETAADTLRREIREELHAEAVIGEMLAVGEVFYPWGRLPDGSKRACHQVCLYFRAQVDRSALPAGDVFHGYDDLGGERFDLDFCWVPIRDLATILTYPPQIAEHLLRGAEGVCHFIYEELPADTRWPD